ncbi:MAG: phosphatase PAP2 family protein [Alphaproteobacteria bacterium]|nr:phosphatase PAP2 family protein [Alphaproteobacteria bacterium]MDE2163476.1 phosphatase PAP2 family protein [Alphaproteobacteria bacterium]MDE2264902.1 phosphatase PAP2 family protein [Alphaproteobacteria bacterium]MDE2500021.1 phosphatase PAP2 family protein [Alphaproteobacteria bacterium]
MLLWVGLFLIVGGLACVTVDRAATHFLYDNIGAGFHRFLARTTHMAKAAHWLLAACLVTALSWAWLRWIGDNATIRLALQCALAFIASLALGSAILHGIKLVLGRRRPRDDLEMNLHGFKLFGFDLDWNSFPSGHALTIMCVAVIATALWPQLAILWFAIALWLGLTRALLTAHFLSDVFVGAGIGLISAREALIYLFPKLMLPWF